MSKKDEEKFTKWMETFRESLPENLRDSWQAIANNDTAREELMKGHLRQEDYTRKTMEVARNADTLSTERAQFAQQQEAWRQWYAKAEKEYQQALQQRGAGAPAGNEAPVAERAMANLVGQLQKIQQENQALAQRVQAIDSGAFNALQALPSLAYKAAKDNLKFDSAEIIKLSQTHNIPLEAAYDRFTADEREQRKEAEFAKKLEEAEKRGAERALSQRSSPDAMGTGAPTAPIWERSEPISDDQTRLEKAYQTFTEAASPR